jgi:hypothetical protein
MHGLGWGPVGSAVTSFVFYLSEGGVVVFFLLGLWSLLGRAAVVGHRTFPNVTERGLQRFSMWLVVFLAGWSLVFKELLPDRGRIMLYTGGSVVYANVATMLLCFCVPVGMVVLWRKVAR